MLRPPWRITDRIDRYATYGAWVVILTSLVTRITDQGGTVLVVVSGLWIPFMLFATIRMWRRTEPSLRIARQLVKVEDPDRPETWPPELQEQLSIWRAQEHLREKK